MIEIVLLILDGDNLTHRAYHSTPKSFHLNAISGFFSMLAVLCRSEKPARVFVAWDTLGVDTYRSELWPAYQTGRAFDREIVEQLEMLPDICGAFGFGVGKAAGLEADDFMASASMATDAPCFLYTTDKDSYQLVSERVTVLSPQRGGKPPERIGPAEVVAKLGVLPEQVPDFKALAGDPSDKIPGIKGIGPKGAAALLLAKGSLEAVVADWPQEQAELALLFRRVATMRTDAPVELRDAAPDWASGADRLAELGLEGVAERVRSLA